MKYRCENGGEIFEIDVEPAAFGYVLRGPDGVAHPVRIETRSDGSQRAIAPWGELELRSARRGAELFADIDGRRLSARVERARHSGVGSAYGAGAGVVIAPMAGKLLRVDVHVGDRVRAGQGLAVIEAMKMENELMAPLDGVVIEVAATAPSTVERGALIIKLEPA